MINVCNSFASVIKGLIPDFRELSARVDSPKTEQTQETLKVLSLRIVASGFSPLRRDVRAPNQRPGDTQLLRHQNARQLQTHRLFNSGGMFCGANYSLRAPFPPPSLPSFHPSFAIFARNAPPHCSPRLSCCIKAGELRVRISPGQRLFVSECERF